MNIAFKFQCILYYTIDLDIDADHFEMAIYPNYNLSKAKLLIEGSSLRLTAKEFSQSLHLILGTALLKDLVAVTTTSSLVHGVGFEDGVEHVC